MTSASQMTPLWQADCQPVRAAALHQFDELVLVARQVALEAVLLVGRVDGDGAHRLRCGAGID
jgi:hypothetical protein